MNLFVAAQFLLLLLKFAGLTHQYSEIGWEYDLSWRGERIRDVDNCVIVTRSTRSLNQEQVNGIHNFAAGEDYPAGNELSHDSNGEAYDVGVHDRGGREKNDWSLFPGMKKISVLHHPVLVCEGGRYDNLNFSLVPLNIGSIVIRWNATRTFPLSWVSIFKNVTCLHLLGEGTKSFINENTDSDPSSINEFITSLRMSEASLTTVPKTFLKKFKAITELSLERNYLSTIEDDAFSELHTIEALFLGHNRITQLNMGWLTRTTKLKILDVQATAINAVPVELGRIRNGLVYIDMSDNFISFIGSSAFSASPKLRIVMLSNNGINTNAFLGMSKLQYLDLAANQLETLNDNLFQYFGEDAFTVNLWENKINCDCNMKWLPEWITQRNAMGIYPDIRMHCAAPNFNKHRVFSRMKSYDFICDRNNKTGADVVGNTHIPSSRNSSTTFLPLEAAKFDVACPAQCKCYYTQENYNGRDEFPVVNCNGANYTQLPSGISPLTRTLELKNNQLQFIDLLTLKELKNLRYLELKNNQITDIRCTGSVSECTFHSMSSLDVSKNKLTHVSAGMLKYFPALHSLEINFNQITNIPEDLLRGKIYLKKVALGPNPIVSELDERLIDDLCLENLKIPGLNLRRVPKFVKNHSSLIKLDLSDNKITELDPDAFRGLFKLEKLWIEHNQLLDIPDGMLRQMPSLIVFALTENNLTTMRESTFEGSSENLIGLRLSENHFKCDCSLAWFKDYVDQEKYNNPSTDMRFTCSEPARVHGLRADDMKTSDFVCLDNDVSWEASRLYQFEKVYSNTEMAIAVIMTIVILLVSIGLIMLYMFYCRRRSTSIPYFYTTINFNSISNLKGPLAKLGG